MEDTKILKLLWDRLEEAIPALAGKYGNRLYQTAMNLLGNPQDAEEAVSDAYWAVWNAIPPERPSPLAGYVYRVGRNIALKRLRANTARKRNSAYDLSLEELAEAIPGETLEERIDARELGRAINRYLDTLSLENRRLFLRRYWFGDQVRDLANAEGMTENALSVRLSRLREKLRQYLTQEGYL